MTESEQAIIDTIFDQAQQRHRSDQAFDAEMFHYVQRHFFSRPEVGYYLLRDILALQESVHALQRVVQCALTQFSEYQENRKTDNDDESGAASAAPIASSQEHGCDAHPQRRLEPHAAPNASLAARYLQQYLNRTRNTKD